MSTVGLDELDLRRYYEEEYPKLHPELDAHDVDRKLALLAPLLDGKRFHSVGEVGCGSGLLLDRMGQLTAARFKVGLDLSRSHLHIARKDAPGNEYVQADAQSLPLRKIDLVIGADVLEHLPRPGALLKDLACMGCTVALYIPLESGIISDQISRLMTFLGRPTNRERYGHLHRFTRRSAVKLITDSGLKIRKVTMVSPPRPAYTSLIGRVLRTIAQQLLHHHPQAHQKLFGGWGMALLLEGSNSAEELES